jgi:uncharacterized Zn-binding protein involved in type VI secretion
MKGVIRLGDPTTHGGKVVSAGARTAVRGKAVARVGDSCSCPIKGHEDCVIIEGHPTILVDGVAVAFEGHRTSCGAALISTVADSGAG